MPPDGSLRWAGALPTLIAWDDEDRHPAGRLEDRGCSLRRLWAQAPQAAARALDDALASLGLAGVLDVAPAGRPSDSRLSAEIVTPAGVRTL